MQLDAANDTYTDPTKVRHINHEGQFYSLSTRHIVHPSPQRTPFLFQAGTSPAGSNFAATHAEGIFVSSHSPQALLPKVQNIRKLAAEKGRDPASLKFFVSFTPILGKTDEEAQDKYEELRKHASIEGGLVLFSGWTGIDISKFPLDQEITAADSQSVSHVLTALDALSITSNRVPKWTPRVIAERAAIGGLAPLAVGSPQTVANEMERWISEADLDGFNIAYVTSPGTFEDVVDLLVPELRARGLYEPEDVEETVTARERVYGPGQRHLRDDHIGSSYKYDVYKEDEPYISASTEAKE